MNYAAWPRPSRGAVVHHGTVHRWFDRQHFYQGLARAWSRTRPQLYVSTGLRYPWSSPSASGAMSIRGGYLHLIEADLWVLEPHITKGARFGVVRRLHDELVARATVTALAELQISPDDCIVWTYASAALPLLRRLKNARTVYWTGDEVVDPRELQLLRAVEHVFTISPPATTEKQVVASGRTRPMPMAIDPDPFVVARTQRLFPDALHGLRRPLLGYGGSITARRMDWSILRAIADRTKGTLVLVGPIIEGAAHRPMTELLQSGNVFWAGHRDEREAPRFLAAFDVGIIPYARNAFNDGSNPVKFYEYLAAGLPVVSTSLPALTGFGDIATFEDDPIAFADAAESAGNQPSAAELVAERQRLARSHDFRSLIAKVEDVLSTSAPSMGADRLGLAP